MRTGQETRVTAWRRTYTILAWLGTGTLAAVAGVLTLDNLSGIFSDDGFGDFGQALQIVLFFMAASLVGGILSTLGTLEAARTSLKTAGMAAAVAGGVLLLFAAIF